MIDHVIELYMDEAYLTKLTSTVSALKATSRNSQRAGGLQETLICRRASEEI